MGQGATKTRDQCSRCVYRGEKDPALEDSKDREITVSNDGGKDAKTENAFGSLLTSAQGAMEAAQKQTEELAKQAQEQANAAAATLQEAAEAAANALPIALGDLRSELKK